MGPSGLLSAPPKARAYRPPVFRLAAPGATAPSAKLDDAHVWRTDRAQAIAYGFCHDGRYWMHWPLLATYGFAPDDAFITAYPHRGASAEKIRDVYRRSVLPMALQAFGFEALHASAVLTARGLVLFAGRSKAGKSTIAFGLSRLGYNQWADDGVVFSLAAGTPVAIPLTFTVRLRQTSWTFLGLETPGTLPWLNEPSDGRPKGIAAICMLSRRDTGPDHGPATIHRVSSIDAFPALLTHAHEFDPTNHERRRRMLAAYLEVAAAVPLFEIAFRPEAQHFDALLNHIVSAVGLKLS